MLNFGGVFIGFCRHPRWLALGISEPSTVAVEEKSRNSGGNRKSMKIAGHEVARQGWMSTAFLKKC